MGLRLYLDGIPQETLSRLLSDPTYWRPYDDQCEGLRAQYAKNGALSEEGEGVRLVGGELGKAWDALHFLLDRGRREGAREPTTMGGAAVLGGHVMPYLTTMYDYAPRYNLPGEVISITESLHSVQVGDLMSEHGAGLLGGEVYFVPGRAWSSGDHQRYLEDRFAHLKRFFERVAERGFASVHVLT